MHSIISIKTLCIIPARLGSTRLPRKPLALIAGVPMVVRTYSAAAACKAIDKVIVATDSEEIKKIIEGVGGHVVMSPSELKTGTDRVAFVAQQFPEYDVVINLQGDEPFIKPEMLTTLIQPFKTDPTVKMTTLGSPLDFSTQHKSPDFVKVLYDFNSDAIYFSRSPVPYFRQPADNVNVLHHKGVYAFTKEFLQLYTQLPQTPMEIAESLEQLRVIEHGFKIRICKVLQQTLEINTPEELEVANVKLNTTTDYTT